MKYQKEVKITGEKAEKFFEKVKEYLLGESYDVSEH